MSFHEHTLGPQSSRSIEDMDTMESRFGRTWIVHQYFWGRASAHIEDSEHAFRFPEKASGPGT
jgi:hypothetical protein